MKMCITKKQLNERVAEVRSLKALREETENALKAVERDIIDFLTANGLESYIGPDYKATYKEQSRATLDKKRLEEDIGSLSEYEKVTTYNVLRIA